MSRRKHEVEEHVETEVLRDDAFKGVPYDPNATDVLGEEYRRQVDDVAPAERRRDRNSPD
jgi:hypothetical protein